MDLIETDNFFLVHPLKERYFSFGEAERSGIVAVAERDVRAAVAFHLPETGEEMDFFNAAIAEQTIFLMLNPEYLTGCYTRVNAVDSAGESLRFSDQKSLLGQRAAALLAPLLNKTAQSGGNQPDDDPGSSGSSDDGSSDSGGDENNTNIIPSVRLQRG